MFPFSNEGTVGLYAERVARNDPVAVVFSADAVPGFQPMGGAEPFIESNPLARPVSTGAGGNPTTGPFKICTGTGTGHAPDVGAINPGGNKG